MTNGTQASERLVTREELAVALKVSLRTVDRMIAEGEVQPVRLRGTLVRFRLSEVFEHLEATARTRKRGRSAKLQTPNSKASTTDEHR